MLTNLSNLSITRVCHNASDVMQTEEWCELAGNWNSKTHILNPRLIGEMVFIYCISGKGWGTVDNKRFEITPGDLFFCPRNIVHSYRCYTETGWSIKWMHFCGDNAEMLCHKAGFTLGNPLHTIGIDSSISRLFDDIVTVLSRTNRDAAWDAAKHLHSLLLLLIKKHSSANTEDPLIDLVDGEYSSLDEMVKKSGYSKYHFCRIFKEQTGKSPWQAVIERKLEHSKELLIGTELPF